jgi:hypothetical protein
MNYHESGLTISKEYFALLHELTDRFFPLGNREPVTLSGLTDDDARRCIAIMRQPMATQWEQQRNWPIQFSRRLYTQWQSWSEAPDDLAGFQRENAILHKLAVDWCRHHRLDIAKSIDPGPPWHIPFLCLFAYAAEYTTGGGDGGYYKGVGELFDTCVDDVVVRDSTQNWSRLWTSVANWARSCGRGFMVAKVPNYQEFAYVGWPQQHALLSTAERRRLSRWLRINCARVPDQDELESWLRGFEQPSVQLGRLLQEVSRNRLRLLTDWVERYFESVQQHVDEIDDDEAKEQLAEAQDQRGGGGRKSEERANQAALARARLCIELSGREVESVYLETSVDVELRSAEQLELGGDCRFLRASGEWRPKQLTTTSGLLGEDGELKRQLEALRVRWPQKESRLFIGDAGAWLEYPLPGRELTPDDQVLVLCRVGQSRQWVNGESGRVERLNQAYELHRCPVSALNRAAWGTILDRHDSGQVAPIKFEGGVRRSRWSQREYLGVALPRVPSALVTLTDQSGRWANQAEDGSLEIHDSLLNEHLSESIALSLTAKGGLGRELLACFPRATPNARFDDLAFEELPRREQTGEAWKASADIELNPQRRFLAVTDGTISLEVAKSRQEAIWFRESKVLKDEERRYWIPALADMGHLKLAASDAGHGTWIAASEARIEVLAHVGAGMYGPYLGRLVGAHDWVRTRGRECEGVEWCEVDAKLGRSEILVRGSKSALRALGCMLGVPIVPCLRPRGASESSTAPLGEAEGFPWLDGQQGVRIWNPLGPHMPLSVDQLQLKSLVGPGGTLIVSQAIGDYATEYHRLRFDGSRWNRSRLHGRSIAGHYWESVRSGWARYGRIMSGSALALPLPYDASTQSLYFLTKLRPPAEIREALCSVSGRSPELVEASKLRPWPWAGWRDVKPFQHLYRQDSWMIRYRFISQTQAESIAMFLGAELALSE